MNLGIVTRPRLGIDSFASSPNAGEGSRPALLIPGAASTTSAAEGRVQAAHPLTNKKHPRRDGPGA